MATKTALVMRATGVQGRGAIDHLVKAGWRVHALVADASSDRASPLKNHGPMVTIYQGSWKEPSTIEAALKGCQALFIVQMPSFTDDAEVQEARMFLQLAKRIGVQHVVHSTTLPLNNPDVREEFKESLVAPAIFPKGDVEELVKASGMTWTLLRPGFFATNLLPPYVYWMYPDLKEGKMINSYGPDCVLGLIDPDDIGAFVAAAVENPSRFSNQTITTVGELVRFDETIRMLAEASKQPIEPIYRSVKETEKVKNNPLIAGQTVCIGLDKFVDMEEVRSWGVPLTSYKQFLNKHAHQLPGVENSASEVPMPYGDRFKSTE